MLRMFINALFQEGTVISASLKRVSVCKRIKIEQKKTNSDESYLPYLIENKYTILMQLFK